MWCDGMKINWKNFTISCILSVIVSFLVWLILHNHFSSMERFPNTVTLTIPLSVIFFFPVLYACYSIMEKYQNRKK